MTWVARNLWDLMRRSRGAPKHEHPKRITQPAESLDGEPADTTPDDPADRSLPMQRRYDAIVTLMKQRYGLRIRKWRSSSSGCAWAVYYADGTMSRLIESPYPRGPMSCAIFMHEVGHHAIGLGADKPRCLEEYHAWRWSLEQMRQFNLNVTPAVEKRMHESLYWALQKAARRGLKRIPVELLPFVEEPERFRQARQAASRDS